MRMRNAMRMRCECDANAVRMRCECGANAVRMRCKCGANALQMLCGCEYLCRDTLQMQMLCKCKCAANANALQMQTRARMRCEHDAMRLRHRCDANAMRMQMRSSNVRHSDATRRCDARRDAALLNFGGSRAMYTCTVCVSVGDVHFMRLRERPSSSCMDGRMLSTPSDGAFFSERLSPQPQVYTPEKILQSPRPPPYFSCGACCRQRTGERTQAARRKGQRRRGRRKVVEEL